MKYEVVFNLFFLVLLVYFYLINSNVNGNLEEIKLFLVLFKNKLMLCLFVLRLIGICLL